ncbi:MAG: hypothetical protein ABSB35_26570 [Bryobacteraceae bacterium]
MNLTPIIILWALLGIALLAVEVYRKVMMLHQEDELVHLGTGEEKMLHRVAQAHKQAHKMDAADEWEETLTALTIVYGLWIAMSYFHGQF